MLKRKIIPAFLASVLAISATAGVSAEVFSENAYAAEELHTVRLVDYAGLLEDDEAETLEEKLDQISEDYDCDVVIVTEESIDGADPMAYADDFYDYNDYGMGDDNSGILLLLTMSERKWKMSTHGDAIRIFTDAGQEYMSDKFVSSLTDGDYYEGFTEFADLCEEFIIQAQNGEPYDVENMPDDSISAGFLFLMSLAVGFVLVIDRTSGDAMSMKQFI